ncbi:hypothetical protein ACS5PU_03230 [Pedobacter sp. GSP4]|uniref:hypothetical protein n=1 Tax=Pedobacter sp. GSP4 TaxID=3453716 RepID=UPI003EEF4ED6
MNENIENNEWLNDAPALAAMGKRNPFSVPEGYFDSVGEHVLSAVFFDGLKDKTNTNSFEVPQNYFETLTERIETKIRLAEITKPENAFAVPANYFDTLQSRINDRIAAETPKKEAKIIPLWRRNIVKYASAACFVLMASFGAYFYQNNTAIPVAQTPLTDLANEQLLYDIDESTIIEHLEAQNTSSSKTNSASDTEMENYILNNFSSSDLSQALNN